MLRFSSPDRTVTPIGESYIADSIQWRILDAFDSDFGALFEHNVAAFKALFGFLPPCIATAIDWREEVVYVEECADPIVVRPYAFPVTP